MCLHDFLQLMPKNHRGIITLRHADAQMRATYRPYVRIAQAMAAHQCDFGGDSPWPDVDVEL